MKLFCDFPKNYFCDFEFRFFLTLKILRYCLLQKIHQKSKGKILKSKFNFFYEIFFSLESLEHPRNVLGCCSDLQASQSVHFMIWCSAQNSYFLVFTAEFGVFYLGRKRKTATIHWLLVNIIIIPQQTSFNDQETCKI